MAGLYASAPAQGTRRMPIDLYRDGDHYILSADLPGIDPASVSLDVDGRVLSIRAARTPRSDEGVNWLARESRTGEFLRQLTLGEGVDRDSISASFDAGVLSVVIPVAEKAKARKIEISSAAAPVAQSPETAQRTETAGRTEAAEPVAA